jgi:hypothetical protein
LRQLRCLICSFQATNFTQLPLHIEAHRPKAIKVQGKYIINVACPTVIIAAALPLIETDVTKCKWSHKCNLMVVGLNERGSTIALRSPSQYNNNSTAALQTQLDRLEQLVDTPITTVDYTMFMIFKTINMWITNIVTTFTAHDYGRKLPRKDISLGDYNPRQFYARKLAIDNVRIMLWPAKVQIMGLHLKNKHVVWQTLSSLYYLKPDWMTLTSMTIEC